MLPEPHGGKLTGISDLEVGKYTSNDFEGAFEISYETAVTIMDMKNGILSPMTGFHGSSELDSILSDQRLENGLPWSIPLLLSLDDSSILGTKEGDNILLKHKGELIAELTISEIYPLEKDRISKGVFGTLSDEHPGVLKVRNLGSKAIAGNINVAANVNIPFRELTKFPSDTRRIFKEKGWKSVSAFQTRNVPHRGHEEIQRLALRATDGLFINPVIGKKKSGDYTDEAILRAYEALIKAYYPQERVIMTPLHYEMMYAGPREAIMHAIMRKNYGCSHFIVGRDHAGVGNFYGPYDAQNNLGNFQDLGIEVMPFQETFYCRKCEQLVTDRECNHPVSEQEHFSGTQIRKLITSKGIPPKQLMRGEVFDEIISIPDPFVH